MNTYFDSALAYLIGDEGSRFTDDPKDPGGATKWGVTLKAWAQFLGKEDVTKEDIAALQFDDIEPFYRQVFWEPMLCDQMLDAGIAIAIFDSAVLFGIITITWLAQQAISKGTGMGIDGKMGPVTLRRLNQFSRKEFLTNFHEVLLKRIDEVSSKNPNLEKFRQGWINRADKLLTLTVNTEFNIKATP